MSSQADRFIFICFLDIRLLLPLLLPQYDRGEWCCACGGHSIGKTHLKKFNNNNNVSFHLKTKSLQPHDRSCESVL